MIWNEMSYNQLDDMFDFDIDQNNLPQEDKEIEGNIDEFNQANSPVFCWHRWILQS